MSVLLWLAVKGDVMSNSLAISRNVNSKQQDQKSGAIRTQKQVLVLYPCVFRKH